MRTNNIPWWQGPHGEWYIVIQVGLFLLVALGPRTWPRLPEWSYPFDLAGTALMVLGGVFAAAGFFGLGKNLTVLPRPREKAMLVEMGAGAPSDLQRSIFRVPGMDW